jgi:hypothetical protein
MMLSHHAGDGDNNAWSPGRARISRKPLRREGRVCPAYTCGSCPVHFFARGPWVWQTPGLPCALHVCRGWSVRMTRALRVARRRWCLPSLRGAQATKQSRLSLRKHSGLLRFARNDGVRGRGCLTFESEATREGPRRFRREHRRRHCERKRSNPVFPRGQFLDCFVANAPRNDGERVSYILSLIAHILSWADGWPWVCC